MTATTRPQATALVSGPRYFRSFAPYYIPFRPIDETTYANTAGLAAYAIAYFDSSGRVVRFTKVQLVRPNAENARMAVEGPTIPGSNVYFAANENNQMIGKRIAYLDTADRTDYFAGTVDPAGRSAEVARVMKQEAFTELYTYWPTGRLRERWTHLPDKTTRNEYYDQKGNAITERIAFQGSEAYTEGLRQLNSGEYQLARESLSRALESAKREQYLYGVAVDLMLLAKVDVEEAKRASPPQKQQLATRAIAAANESLPLLDAFDNRSGVTSSLKVLLDAQALLN